MKTCLILSATRPALFISLYPTFSLFQTSSSTRDSTCPILTIPHFLQTRPYFSGFKAYCLFIPIPENITRLFYSHGSSAEEKTHCLVASSNLAQQTPKHHHSKHKQDQYTQHSRASHPQPPRPHRAWPVRRHSRSRPVLAVRGQEVHAGPACSWSSSHV